MENTAARRWGWPSDIIWIAGRGAEKVKGKGNRQGAKGPRTPGKGKEKGGVFNGGQECGVCCVDGLLDVTRGWL